MDEAFNAGLEFDECAEVCDTRDGAADALVNLIARGDGFPRFGLELF